VALACEIVGEDYITLSKTARGAIADPDFHLPCENKNVLPPGRGVPIAEIVRRETAEHETRARLKCNVMALLLGGQREIFKMGLAVLARVYPYDHARAPSSEEIIVHAKYSASHVFGALWHQWVAARKEDDLISEGLRPCSGRGRYRPVFLCPASGGEANYSTSQRASNIAN
jgi:hypothetical protein